MSLQVWLPLTKDLRQQGLSSMTVENHNATLNTAGKLGSCYYFNGSQQWLQLSNNLGNFYNNDWSVACWLKPTDSTRSIILSEYSGTGASNVAIELTTARIVRLYWNGSPDINFSTAGALPLNEWTHLVMTKQGRIVKLYFNGELKQTYTNSSDFSTRTSACQPRIGDDYRGNSGNSVSYQGYMNDFRMYDHCLSPMEVKQISQGLVLHYPLDRQGWGQENLLKESHVAVSTTSYAMHDYYFVSGKEPVEGQTYTVQLKGQLGTGKTYFGLYNSGGSISCVSLTPATQQNGIYKATFTWRTSTASNTYLRVYHMASSTSATSTIEWIKLEEGSVATPWCPNSTDTNNMGLNSTTEYDCSGFCNNGTKTGTFTWTSDTPKYAVSQYCIGTNYIHLTPPSIEIQTIAIWANWKAIPSGQSVILVDNGSGIGLGLMNTGILCSTSGAGSSYTFSKASLVANTWYHFVVVKTGTTTRKLYINGVEQTVTSNTSNWTFTVNELQLGKRSTTSDGFIGKLSDFRAYATALSASDVKSLYQNCATIDPDGTIRGQIRS